MFKCAICEKIFESNAFLIHHKTEHAKEDLTFTCDLCKSSFTDHCQYMLHTITHIAGYKQEIQCLECGEYKRKAALPLHILTHYSKTQTCHVCNKVLKDKELKWHMRSHSAFNKQINCKECGKNIKSGNYELHMRIHKVKEFRCEFCDQVFASRKQCVQHSYRHTKEKTEICHLCGYSTYTEYAMKRHKEKHTKDHRYQCDICNIVKSSKGKLAIHIKNHTSYKCKCRGCKYEARTVKGIKKHQMSTHYYCNTCEEGFRNMQALRRHQDTYRHKQI